MRAVTLDQWVNAQAGVPPYFNKIEVQRLSLMPCLVDWHRMLELRP